MSDAELIKQLTGNIDTSKLDRQQVKNITSSMMSTEIGPFTMTPDEADMQRRNALSQTTATIRREMATQSHGDVREKKKAAKIIRVGSKCVVLHPNGKLESTVIQKGKEQLFFDSKLGNGWISEPRNDLAYGELAGCIVNVAYSPVNEVNKMKKNINGEKIMGQPIKGCLCIWTDRVNITKEMVLGMMYDG